MARFVIRPGPNSSSMSIHRKFILRFLAAATIDYHDPFLPFRIVRIWYFAGTIDRANADRTLSSRRSSLLFSLHRQASGSNRLCNNLKLQRVDHNRRYARQIIPILEIPHVPSRHNCHSDHKAVLAQRTKAPTHCAVIFWRNAPNNTVSPIRSAVNERAIGVNGQPVRSHAAVARSVCRELRRITLGAAPRWLRIVPDWNLPRDADTFTLLRGWVCVLPASSVNQRGDRRHSVRFARSDTPGPLFCKRPLHSDTVGGTGNRGAD